MSVNIKCPSSLKPIQQYLEVADQHDDRDPVVSYWCRLYALQTGLKLDRASPQARSLFTRLMDWLEKQKKALSVNEAITLDIVAQAHVENYALKLFLWADSEDRSGVFNKNVVKAFYTAGVLFDVLETFGKLSEEIEQNRKYAKWKAAYIHACLKEGQTPVPGPALDGEGSYDAESAKNKTVRINSKTQDVPTSTSTASISGGVLRSRQVEEAQKYCKFAMSALNFDDVPTAVENLQKALSVLQTEG